MLTLSVARFVPVFSMFEIGGLYFALLLISIHQLIDDLLVFVKELVLLLENLIRSRSFPAMIDLSTLSFTLPELSCIGNGSSLLFVYLLFAGLLLTSTRLGGRCLIRFLLL